MICLVFEEHHFYLEYQDGHRLLKKSKYKHFHSNFVKYCYLGNQITVQSSVQDFYFWILKENKLSRKYLKYQKRITETDWRMLFISFA